jgi:23S rRNA C2498 (ribose-2'-O)-methylase RlmM
VHKRTISSVKRVQFVSDRISYIILRGSWCHIIVLNVHAPTQDKTDDVKDSLYNELERVFDKSQITYENSVRRFQCQSTQRRYF